MASFFLFERTKGKIDTLEIDALISEEHGSEYEITDHPVEAGADVTDHKRRRPRELRITGVISNTPLSLFNFDATDRAGDAWDKLKDLQAGETLIDVVTSLETYSNMQIVSLAVPRDAARGNVLEFSATLRELITAESKTVEPPAATSTKPKKLGKKPTPPAEDAARQSLLSKLGGFLGL